jgi:pyridoxal phosphate enzyme (YggS family)
VLQAGTSQLGENYPEETVAKMPSIHGRPSWHMIGHLQSRKIKFIIDGFSMIHSIDREEIAIKLNDALQSCEKRLPALVEVNLSGEETKSGFSAWDEKEWPALADRIIKLNDLPAMDFIGLMTMPPFEEDPEASRKYFSKCRKFLEQIQKRMQKPEFCQLSMGTSIDYAVAIEEGATYLRIGQAIMGERTYK